MNITVIAQHFPTRASGGPVRNYNLIKQLSSHARVTVIAAEMGVSSHELQSFRKNVCPDTHLFSIPDQSSIERVAQYLSFRVPYLEKYKASDFRTVLHAIPLDTDIIQLEELNSFAIAEQHLKTLPGKKVLDAHNIDYLRVKSEFDNSPLLRKIAGYPVLRALHDYELYALRMVDHVLACSDTDADYFARYLPSTRISVIPNGADTTQFIPHPKHTPGKQVLFMGLLSYQPNTAGIEWYLREVHPGLQRANPDYRFVIIGKNPPEWLTKRVAHDPTILLRGYVERVQDEIAQADVCICPVFSGSGTRLKLLEYMAMGKAVVSTSKGAEGLAVSSGHELLLADTPPLFISAVQSIFDTAIAAKRLGAAARNLIETRYSWQIIGKQLYDIYHSL